MQKNQWIRTGNLLLAFVVVILSFGTTLLDIYLRIYQDTYVLIAVGAATALMAGGALLIISSRRMYIRSSLADVPKLFVPINEGDIPKRVYKLVHKGLSKAASISNDAKPIVEDANPIGYGKPGSSFENIDFKSSALQTIDIFVDRVSSFFQDTNISDHGPSAIDYVYLAVQCNLVESEMAVAYLRKYHAIRYGPGYLEEKEFIEFMKLFTLLLKRLK